MTKSQVVLIILGQIVIGFARYYLNADIWFTFFWSIVLGAFVGWITND